MTAIDLDAARATFERSSDLTVGIEEEFAILDPQTLDLVPRFTALRDAAAADPVLAAAVAGELISSEIEIRSGRGEDLASALSRQRDLRGRLFALAAREGLALGATGTHPFADYRAQQIIDTPHYRVLDQQLRWVAWRNNTFSLHVHAGVRGADRAVAVCDRLRPVLPTLLAVSASSPLLDGIDTGLHSARTQSFTRMFPRCGIPDAFGDWDAWARYVRMLVDTGSVQEFTQLWWSVRPHHSFGTVEVRICDAQPTAPESDALAALIVACIATAVAEVDAGGCPPTLPGRLIEENLWRAIRGGRDARLLHLHADPVVERTPQQALHALLEWTGPARARHGIEVALPARNGAQRQRTLIEQGATPREVQAHTVSETRETYSARTQEAIR